MMNAKRLTLFAGHYGSGKTNIALNYAVKLRKEHPVTLADLDIVNPYFRTKDSAEWLAQQGVDLICSPFANSNLDVPAMPKEVYSLIECRDRYGVLDIGGDDRGALALGRYAPAIREENDYEMLFVINRARPLTATVEGTLEVLREIESAGSLPFTGIVHNTNLGLHTTPEDVLSACEYASAVSAAAGIPIRMTTVRQELVPELEGKIQNLFPLRLQELYYQIKTEDLYG